MPYIELHSRSAFSFLEGASLPEALAGWCAELSMPAMALLDRDGVYGAPRFHLAAEKAKVKAHFGSEVTVRTGGSVSRFAIRNSRNHIERQQLPNCGTAELPNCSAFELQFGSSAIRQFGNFEPRCAPRQLGRAWRDLTTHNGGFDTKPRTANSESRTANNELLETRNLETWSLETSKRETSKPSFFRLPLLIRDRTGYQNLCRLITRMKLRAPKYPLESKPETIASTSTEELAEFSSGLICLTGGDEGPLAVALAHGGMEEGRRTVEELTRIFGRENVYIELQRHFTREEEARNHAAIAIARSLKLPIVATNGVQHATTAEREILDVLTAIRTHNTLDTTGRLLARNAERHLKPAREMERIFADLPEAIAATEEISSRLEFKLTDLGYQFPKYPVPEGETMMSFLRKRTEEGARERYLHCSKSRELWPRAQRQIARELSLIERLKLEGYFLIVWDIVRFCRDEGILVQGRGSAANSAVCYSLGITAVDPVGMDLLFERFLSEERGEWPDIDIDLPSGDRRERVIQHIYEKYGKLGAAMTANVITYRGRLAAREMGKALGFDVETTARLSAMVGSWEYKDPKDTLEAQFHQAGFDLRHHRMRKFFELCLAVQDLPRHLGQHSGGMVICQGQLDSVVPLEPASMPDRVVVQWDKDDCADLGIIKVDLLGLGMMAVLQDSLGLIRDHYGEEVDLAQLPPDDSKVYAALQKADTVGLFQVESRAQMSSLPRIQPENFYDIVVQVAIIRPGPIVGKMVNPYIKRRQKREQVSYPHPSLEPVLHRTLGVPLFQEQLLRMAMIAAGFTGGEAEELRRAFGFKRSEARMADVEKKLRAGMDRNGITGDAQEQIIHSITSFALYGFPESHAASFALLAYASAYLKAHYLAAFTAALLNNQPMGFYHPATIVKDAQRHGLRVLPIDVTVSDWLCAVEEVQSTEYEELRNCETAELRNCAKGKLDTNSPRRRGGTEEEVSSFEFQVSSDWEGHGFSRAENALSSNGALAPEFPNRFALRDEFRNSALPQFRNPTGNRQLATGNSPALRLGLRYARGLREEAAQALVRARKQRPFTSIDDLVRRVPELRRNELITLAEIGALNRVPSTEYRVPSAEELRNCGTAKLRNCGEREGHGFSRALSETSKNLGALAPEVARSITNEQFRTFALSHFRNPDGQEPKADYQRPNSVLGTRYSQLASHRRSALWQIERATRAAGPLLEGDPNGVFADENSAALAPMTAEERLVADFRGTGLTVGPHPMAYRRDEMRKLGIKTATELERIPHGKRVKAAGCVICRQRPGTASGFVFLSLEDETGIANAIVTPDLFDQYRFELVSERFLLVEGILQNQDNVVSVKAERITPLNITAAETTSHDFH